MILLQTISQTPNYDKKQKPTHTCTHFFFLFFCQFYPVILANLPPPVRVGQPATTSRPGINDSYFNFCWYLRCSYTNIHSFICYIFYLSILFAYQLINLQLQQIGFKSFRFFYFTILNLDLYLLFLLDHRHHRSTQQRHH